MMDDEIVNDRPDRRRPWGRGIGILLMLPVGLTAILVLFLLFGGSSSFGSFRGEWLIIIIAVLLVVFIVRILYRRSRRRYWMQQHQGRGPMRILRERYARGEITKEQFDQMSQDLQQRRNR
jgi:uncharacterized membrane protein